MSNEIAPTVSNVEFLFLLYILYVKCVLCVQKEEKEDRAAEVQFVDEHGRVLARRVSQSCFKHLPCGP